jgi:hypothetical protein
MGHDPLADRDPGGDDYQVIEVSELKEAVVDNR